jgi:hypothetical protein
VGLEWNASLAGHIIPAVEPQANIRTPGSALSICVRTTAGLLLVSAYLVVLGLFNSYLKWDIFSPRVERLLWGVFGSCLALGAFGVAITFVLGINEVVGALRLLLARVPPEGAVATPPRRRYGAWLGILAGLLAATVAGLSLLNQRIERRRTEVFKAVVRDQMKQLSPRFVAALAPLERPCEDCVTRPLVELMSTLSSQSFCESAELLLADTTDTAFLWRLLPASRYQDTPPRFERRFVATDAARVVQRALQGDPTWIDQINRGRRFVWNHVILGQDGAVLGVLRVQGNPRESFRDYRSIAAGTPEDD